MILLALTVATAAQAQIVPPPAVPSIQPPPAPPPPAIEVPKVPKMDAPPPAPKAPPVRRSGFGDRVLACLSDPYAARLSATERVAYSRHCANTAD